MQGNNTEVATQLEEAADLLSLSEANPFRVRAYRNAARTIRSLDTPLTNLVSQPDFHLDDLPGIGKDLAGKIKEILDRGSFKVLSDLRERIPHGIRDLMQVPGIGPKKAMLLNRTLNVSSLHDLELAVKAGTITGVKGFGAKSAEALAHALEVKGLSSGRMLVNEADSLSKSVVQHLTQLRGLEVTVAGSVRRGAETVGDLDFVATGSGAARIIDHLIKFDREATIIAQGPTKISLRLKNARQIDLRVVSEENFGAALLYFTGSKSHNLELRRLAQSQGLKLNEYGLFRDTKRVAGATETEIYQALGLDLIPPELREGRGEITLAAKHQLPELVSAADVLGDFHVHTMASDGINTIEEMATRASQLGYTCLAITDHSERVTIAHGLSRERLAREWAEIDNLTKKFPQLRILKGIEVDILDEGVLDISTEMLKAADWVVAAVHYNRHQARTTMTRRIIKALRTGVVHALAHPTGRLIGRRPELAFDLIEITKAAIDYGVALEINAQPERLDLNSRMIEIAARQPVDFVLATDAHSVAEMGYMKFALAQARRGGLSSKRIVNCRHLRRH